MGLEKYFGHRIKIVTNEGKEFCGWVSDYFPPEENESGKESFALETPAIEFSADEISEITIIQ